MENLNVLLVKNNEGNIVLPLKPADEVKAAITCNVVYKREEPVQFRNRQQPDGFSPIPEINLPEKK